MITSNEVDVLIVGAGAGGSAVARKLANSNLSVLCLEQGSFMNDSLLPANFENWYSVGKISMNPFPLQRAQKQRIPIDDSSSPIKLSFFEGVGGSTLLFSGQYPRFHPEDFEEKQLTTKPTAWPISYDDLESFYEENMQYTPVAGLEGDPVYPLIKNLLPPVPLGKMGEKLAQGFNSLGWHWWPSYSAIATRKFGHHGKCVNIGICNLGCPQAAKGSSDISYWTESLKRGIVLRTNCQVIRIDVSTSNQVTGVSYVDQDGSECFQPAKTVVLAAGGIGTPTLLLNSKNKKYENGLANGSGQVGKNLMLHPLGYVEGLFKENLESDFGPQGCCFASHEFCRSGNLNPSEGGFSMQVLRGPGIAESASRWFKRGKLPINSDFAKRLLDRYNHTAHIAIIVEDFPEEHNSVSLIENSYETRLRVNYEISQLSRQRLKRGLRVASEVMRESGAHDVIQFAPIQESGWHIMGTCKMGHSADDSVVNSIGETHEVQNLFIADASIFASSSTLNPSATIHALGLMIATQILRRFS